MWRRSLPERRCCVRISNNGTPAAPTCAAQHVACILDADVSVLEWRHAELAVIGVVKVAPAAPEHGVALHCVLSHLIVGAAREHLILLGQAGKEWMGRWGCDEVSCEGMRGGLGAAQEKG